MTTDTSQRDRTGIILLATRSEAKQRELLSLLASLGRDVITLAEAGVAVDDGEDAIESHPTFAENALAKARWFHHRTGLPSIADDSGLVVDALDGRPGVRSRRWSGRDDLVGPALDAVNNQVLLQSLNAADAAGSKGRVARYVCAAAYVDGQRELVRTRETFGLIVSEPRGHGGFGYDPYFWSPELGRTFAEADVEEKAGVSHRGRAVRALCEAIVAS